MNLKYNILNANQTGELYLGQHSHVDRGKIC